MICAAGYFQENGYLYKEGTPEEEERQRRAYTAMLLAIEIIRNDCNARHAATDWTYTDPSSGHTSRPASDDLFRLMCEGPSTECGRWSHKKQIVMWLVGAMTLLVLPVLAVLGVTIYQGVDAEKTREKIKEIKALKKEATERSIQETYAKMIPILREEYTEKVVSTLSTAVITVGLSFLTAAAIMALYAKIFTLPIPPLATTFAITGGSVVGGGMLFHAIRLLIQGYFRIEARENLYKDLCFKSFSLHNLVPAPREVLHNNPESKASLNINGGAFTMIKGDYLSAWTTTFPATNASTPIDSTFPQLEVPIKKA